MSITASNNPLPSDPNDKYKEKLDRGGYQGTAQDLQNQINELTAPDEITKKGVVNVVGDVLSIDALEFEWRLNTVEHTNVEDFSSTINPAGSGNKRVDIFVLTQYNAVVKIEGEVTTDFFVKRLAPEGTLECASVQIDGDTIGTPEVSDANTASLLAHIEKTDNPHQVTKEQVGLSNVDNTADIDKPVSTAQAAADADVLAAANAYTDSKVVGIYTFKGNKADYAALIATTGMAIGDVYNLLSNEKNYAWTGTAWDDIGGTFDISGKEDVTNKTDDETTSITESTKYFSVKGFWNAIKIKFFVNLPAKATAIVDADTLALGDSEDSGKTKTRTFAQLLVTLGTRLATYFQTKDTKFYIGTSGNVQDAWSGGTVYFTANCTITVPSTLGVSFEEFGFRTMPGVTVTWAITAPFTWETTPSTTPEKTDGLFTRYNGGNTVIIRW